jgi:hypothetical protein
MGELDACYICMCCSLPCKQLVLLVTTVFDVWYALLSLLSHPCSHCFPAAAGARVVPQMSAAAFIQGLLDLEGSSLTPILVSLVTKNASMLDAFGKVWSQLCRA